MGTGRAGRASIATKSTVLSGAWRETRFVPCPTFLSKLSDLKLPHPMWGIPHSRPTTTMCAKKVIPSVLIDPHRYSLWARRTSGVAVASETWGHGAS